MMKKSEYLRLALKSRCYEKKSWIIAAFSLVREDPAAYQKDAYPYRIVQTPTGVFFINPEKPDSLELIEDAPPNTPLFRFLDSIVIDSSVCLNAVGEVETKIGNVLLNLIAVVSSFGNKLPFFTGKVTVGKIEAEIAKRLETTPKEGEPRDPAKCYVDEYEKFVDALNYMTGFSQLCVHAASEKTMTAPTGLAEFKAALLEKYKGKLTDPAELVKFEKELLDFDAAYMKGDPSDGTFITGKIKNVARKKLYLTVGADQSFKNSLTVTPVINSLQEGLPTDPESFTALMNGSRLGSYARGADTVKGGVSAKILLRAGNNFKIVQDDCQTKLGIHRYFTTDNQDQLVGRSVMTTTGWVPVSEATLSSFLNKPLIVRSPMYCKSNGDNICQYCAGERLARNPNGISTALTEISAIILSTFMAMMHAKALTVAKYDYKAALS